MVLLTPTPAPASETPEPRGGGAGTGSGDVPDNAIFLTYKDAPHHFWIQYVEGWQVTPNSDGVLIADKDSSETVTVVAATDAAAYITGTDLPNLQGEAGFTFVKQDRVKVNGLVYDHLVFHLPSLPDAVTGKQVPSLVDRYYVPGSGVIAVVNLSTPDGVDNFDAFRQMIESFTWR